MTGGIPALILLLFAAALVKLGLSEELLLYVRASARPWVLSAGVALALLAGWSLLLRLRTMLRADREDGEQLDADGENTAGHGHSHGSTRTSWLVLAPVVAVLVVAPPSLGAFTAEHAPPVDAAVTGRHVALAAGASPVRLGVFEFLLLSSGNPAALSGRPVTLVGFVQQPAPGGFTLARLVITCCAADASVARVSVLDGATAPPAGTWVSVTGTFAGLGSDAGQTPRLAGATVTTVPQPTDPYD